jgi:hypothetical protein
MSLGGSTCDFGGASGTGRPSALEEQARQKAAFGNVWRVCCHG